MKTCPSCLGTGKVSSTVHLNRGPSKRHVWLSYDGLACLECDGTAQISDERAAEIAGAEQFRLDRKTRGLTLGEEARRLGIPVVEVSRRERGRTEALDKKEAARMMELLAKELSRE